jgi:hypothetical protein
MSLMDAALELARSGVPVFPCGPDKAPRVTGGFKSASTDEAIIKGWSWEDGAMIGAAVTPGVIVVDVDPRNGGEDTVTLLKANGKALTPTRLVRTRSGGQHRYYTVPLELELRNTLGPGVDIKKAGKGYVIAPPSEGYRVGVDIDPAPAPEWLLEELRVEARESGNGEAVAPKFWERFEHGTAYGLRALDAELGRMATQHEGGRNHALNRAAFALAQLTAGGELNEEHAKAELERVAVLIGLEPQETAATIESGWAAGEQEPRQAPERELDAERTTPSVLAVDPEAGDPEAEGRFWTNWEVDEPAPPFFLHPVLPKNAYVLVYGATEAAKSMAMVGLLAQGSHHDVRSSVYSLENPPHTDRDRLRRWAPDRDHFRLTNQPLDFNDPRQVEALVRRESDWGDGRGSDVILIDTYSMAFNSRSDDGNAKAIEFARRVRFVMAQVGCSVIVVDHTGFEGDEPRDASAKRQAVDVAILMEKVGEWAKGKSARFTMRNRKSARFANPFRLAGAIKDGRDGALELDWDSDAPGWETP